MVTATYRDTMLMDTPMSISAITDVEIEMRGVEDIQSLYLSIPGLNYGVATQTYHRVNARGIDSLAWGDTGAVSTYVDNLPIAGAQLRSNGSRGSAVETAPFSAAFFLGASHLLLRGP